MYSNGYLVANLKEISGDFGSRWKTECAEIPETVKPDQGYEIKFKAIRGSTYWTDIGIDDVALIESCPRKKREY